MIVKNIYIPNPFVLFKQNDPENDETGSYFVVVEFKTDKNETITKQLDSGYGPRKVGERMQVIYDPSNPINFITKPGLKLEIIPRVLVAMGLIGLIVSIIIFLGTL